MDTLLKVTSIDLIISASLTGLNALGLNKHSFSVLLISSIVRGEHYVFMLFNDFDSRLLKTLTDKHLKDRLNL